VKQVQASERTELGTPLRSNSHVKLGHGRSAKGGDVSQEQLTVTVNKTYITD
jgi:hypothetical protein